MADLTDIFDEEPQAASLSIEAALEQASSPVAQAAQAACAAKDRATRAALLYKNRHEELKKQMDAALFELRSEMEESQLALETASQELLGLMDVEKLDEVNVTDRGPIRVNVTKGSKKSITKGFLLEELGKQQGESLWKKVPRNPDKRRLVIPDPYEDEPSA